MRRCGPSDGRRGGGSLQGLLSDVGARTAHDRPVADVRQLCHRWLMRRCVLALATAVVLTGCAPRDIAADRCWSVSIGDRVQGTAVLHAYAGDGCIECGAYLTSTACPARTTGFVAANNEADRSYDQLLRTSPVAASGYIARTVFLAGRVIPNGASGEPMIQAEQLRSAD